MSKKGSAMIARLPRETMCVLQVEQLESRELLNGQRLGLHTSDLQRSHSTKHLHTAPIVAARDLLASDVIRSSSDEKESRVGDKRRSVQLRDFDPDNFVSTIDNPFFPLVPGTTFIYEGKDGGHSARDEFFVTHKTKKILGVTTTVIRDRAFVDGELAEETFDWLAQDEDGNVWYFGEDSREIENGEVVNTEGSWEAGVHGARAGIIMEAHPRVGDKYQQEFAKGVAEDRATVLSLDEKIKVPYGTFKNCLETKDFTPLEPDVVEHKYYARGIGFIRSVQVKGGHELLELVSITKD
jgi:hypothetical protein